jgi:hypothetical protein
MMDNVPFFHQLIENPVTWSVLVMLTIVSLLMAWEAAVETARERTPPVVQQVVDRILGEMGGLGFIGLFLSIALNKQIGLGHAVGQLSEHFLGDEELLIERFEFIHQLFFQTAMIYFATAAYMIIRVLNTIQKVSCITEETLVNTREGKNPEMASKLADVLGVLGSFRLPANEETVVDGAIGEQIKRPVANCEAVAMLQIQESGKKTRPWQRELFLTMEERGAEVLVLRERLLFEMNLPETFRIETYLEKVFTRNKLDIIEISPLSWLPLIPALSFCGAIDLSHNVFNSQSANAVASSGYFFSTPLVLWPSAAIQVLCLVWGSTNFYKMAGIKSMLVPSLVCDDAAGGAVRFMPPEVENPELRRSFQSTPPFWRPIEAIFQSPVTNRVEELFGTVGGAGPAFYLQSIKFHLWLCVTSIVIFASQILPRDFDALLHADRAAMVGDPAHLVPEIWTFAAFALLNLAQLAMAPTTFLNYCLVTCVEDMVKGEDISCSILEEVFQEETPTAIGVTALD